MKGTANQNLLRIVCKHVSTSVCSRLQQFIKTMSLRANAKQERRRFILQQISHVIPAKAGIQKRF